MDGAEFKMAYGRPSDLFFLQRNHQDAMAVYEVLIAPTFPVD